MEKDKERERLVQLEAMEVEVSKFKVAKAQGNTADLVWVKGALSAQLKKYLEDIEAGKGDGVVRYHSGGSMKLNACILVLAHMVYL